MQVGSFCTSNLSSVTALQQYFVIHNKWPGGIKELDDEYFGSRLLCLILFICSDHVWNQSYWSVITRASQPTYFLMKVSVKQCVNRLSLKEIISWLRMNFWSWKIMDWANAIIVCTMFGAWIWKRWITSFKLKGFGTIRQKILHCQVVICWIASCSITRKLAGKWCSSPSSCCLQGIGLSCVESLLRLVQLTLSPLWGQPEPFPAVQAPAEQRHFHFLLCLPISRTLGHGSQLSLVT